MYKGRGKAAVEKLGLDKLIMLLVTSTPSIENVSIIEHDETSILKSEITCSPIE